MPEAMSNGRSEPSSASPNTSIARTVGVDGALEVAGEGDVVLEREVHDRRRTSAAAARSVSRSSRLPSSGSCPGGGERRG